MSILKILTYRINSRINIRKENFWAKLRENWSQKVILNESKLKNENFNAFALKGGFFKNCYFLFYRENGSFKTVVRNLFLIILYSF
jgi:hypothetical protein